MSGIANLSMDHSRSEECLYKSSSSTSPSNPTNTSSNSELKQNSSGVNLSSQGEGTDSELNTMNCLLSTSSRFEVTKTSTDGSHIILHDVDDGNVDEDQEPLKGTIDSDEQTSPVGSYDNTHTFGAPTYRTVYQTNKSLRHYTKEALPRIDNYRNMMSIQGQLVRPTVEELRGIQTTVFDSSTSKQSDGGYKGGGESAVKFGWIQGVLVRCLLNIWGVMLFLRLSWVVAQAGIGAGLMIILLATAVTTITALSMSAICTNGEVKGGGTYFMISRSLGPEFGGAIGMIFSLANAVAIAMYAVGFAETLAELLRSNNLGITSSYLNDVRIISCVAVAILLCIALIGTEWESKAQLILLIILLAAMFDFMLGSVLPPSEPQMTKGFIGWNVPTLSENFVPDYRNGESFFSVFSVFFPAATGILAGANISGDLKDPQRAIPLGTLLAIGITTLSYMLFALISGGVVVRDANGLIEVAGERITNVSAERAIELLSMCNQTQDGRCHHGIHNTFGIMEMVSVFGPIIYAGIFAASLSSALASLVSAPKVFQALAKDKLFPYIDYFAKGFGKNNEPRRGYFLAFAVAICCCIIGDLNMIAPIISNFFLAAYCLINFSCFHASFAKSLGFRPSFRYYNMWSSLAGAVLCFGVMFITDWPTAVITFFIIGALYIWVLYRKPDVNWGSSTQAQTYRAALQYVYKLNLLPDHVKNYRPQIFVLSGDPSARPALIDFSYSITRGLGLLVCGNAIQGPLSQRARDALTQSANDWLIRRKVKAFYNVCIDENFSRSVGSMIQSLGIGKLRPNFVLMGWKQNWLSCEYEEFNEYFDVIHDTFDKHLALAILRVPGGLDYSKYGKVTDITDSMVNKKGEVVYNASFASIDLMSTSKSGSNSSLQNNSRRSSADSSPPPTPNLPKNNSFNISNHPTGHHLSPPGKVEIPRDVLSAVNQFQRRQRKGTIDVWWMYDDGGLTMLVPYILSTRTQWAGCKIRVFALANKRSELDRDQRNMAALLSKFRIDYSDVTVIPDVQKSPRRETKDKFNEMISKFRIQEDTTDSSLTESGTKDGGGTNGSPSTTDGHGLITDAEVLAVKDKTNRHLRLHELLQEHSSDATLVVMTLSMPRKGTVSAPMYMAWLELITQKMPPFLLIRGNQTSVLTFYS